MFFRSLKKPNVLVAFRSPQVDNPTACHAGLGITARSIALSLGENRITATSAPVKNGEYLWSQLSGPAAATTHVVFCAPYIDAAFLSKMVRHFPGKKFAMTYHSNVGFLTVDQFATGSIPKYLALQEASGNFFMSANSRQLCDAVEAGFGQQCVYLPNLYHLTGTVERTKPRWTPAHTLKIGLFGATRILKNPLTAAWATLIIQRQLGCAVELHVSTGRDEGGGPAMRNIEAILTDSPVKLVRVPWLTWDDFRRYIYGMDLMLQPSFTESFNNVTADGAYCGVPSVVSDAIDWAPQSWTAKADQTADVARVALELLGNPNAAREGYDALQKYMAEGLKAWRNWLS